MTELTWKPVAREPDYELDAEVQIGTAVVTLTAHVFTSDGLREFEAYMWIDGPNKSHEAIAVNSKIRDAIHAKYQPYQWLHADVLQREIVAVFETELAQLRKEK